MERSLVGSWGGPCFFPHRFLKKVPMETVTFELRPQRNGGASYGDIRGRGKCPRQREPSVQRPCGRSKAGMLQESREANQAASK